MSQEVVLSIKGLFTYPNNLSAVPKGALVEAENIYIDRNDVAQPRRGFNIFSDTAFITTPKSLHDYQSRIILHQSDLLEYETDPVGQPGNFTSYEESIDGTLVTATIESPSEATGLKIKSIEQNRNFYYTSQKGIMKIDNVTNSTLRSGVPQALDFDLALVDQEGFLLQNTAVAYRVLWGYKDANNNLILGAPSQREIIYYYGVPQFIIDINAMLTEIDSQGATFTETYPAPISSTATVDTIYSTMKDIVKGLNSETLLSFKEYEAGGTIQISSITTRPKSVIPASSYFIFEATNGRYVPWFDVTGADPAPDPNLQSDLLLTDTLIPVDISAVVDPNDATEVAVLLQTAIDGSTAEQTNELTDNTLILRTLYDKDVMNTVDGVDPTGNTFSTLQEGSELEGAALTLEALQEAFDIIVSNLNADDPPVDPDFEEATTAQSVSLYITIPQDIINLSQSGTTFFYQVYRSALFDILEGIVTEPDDELQLVYEDNPNPAEITAGFVGPFTDETTDTSRAQSALLYTNPSQEGILQSNYQPPYALDINLYKNQLFFANTFNKYNAVLSLLTGRESTGPGNPGFVLSTKSTLVNQGITYTADVYGPDGDDITITLIDPVADGALSILVTDTDISVTLAQAAGVLTTTATQLVTALNLDSNVTDLISISGSGASPLTALVQTSLSGGSFGSVIEFDNGVDNFGLIFIDSSEDDNFEEGIIALVDDTSGTVDPSDDLSVSQVIEQTAQKIVKAINRHQDNPFLNAYYISGFNDLPGQIKFETRYIEQPIFTITCNEDETDDAFSPSIDSPDAVATNEVAVNRVYFSKFQQPEAVPSLNFFDIGAGDKAIIRVIPSRDSLFVFKEDGVFTISGQEGENFQVNTLDNTCKIKGPETAVIGNNQIYLFTDEGIVRVTEAGPETISRPIEDKILALPDTALYSGLNRSAFGVFYDTEKKYYLWLPTEPEDQVATQCFVWNTYTDTWTRLPISKTCGIVNSRDNKLYLGASDTFHLEQERKHFNIFDYADRDFTNQIILVSHNELTDKLELKLQSVLDIAVGDVIEQTEYLNPYYFNRVLVMLDENGNAGTDYYTDLVVTEKSELNQAVIDLAAKLDLELSVGTYTAILAGIPGTTPAIILERFNALVEEMNVDATIDQSDFPTVDETFTFYSHIMEIDESALTVTMQDDFSFEIGTITTYQSIPTSIIWAPQHAGNPAIWKHFRESNMIFSDIVLRQLEIGFASDVSQNYETKEMNDESLAGWGLIEWGLSPWGSDPQPRAFRTYIPRLKQRSRYLNVQFAHSRAFEYYLLNGISLSYDSLTERVTR